MDLDESYFPTSPLSSETNATTGEEMTNEDYVHTRLAVVILRTLSIVVAFFLIVASNLVNLIVLPHVQCFADVNRFLLQLLAATDLLFGICIVFSSWPAIADFWPYGDVMCKVIGSIGTLLATASSLTLMCVSVDRYLAVTRPLRYVSIVTLKRARCAVSAVWLVSVISVAFVGTASWPPFQNISYDRVLCNCVLKFLDGAVLPRALGAAAVCVVVPSVVITVANGKLLLVSIGHAKRIDAMPGNRVEGGQRKKVSSRELKAIRTTLVITGVYYVAWTPFIATQVYMAFSSQAIADWLHFLSGYLVISNSWWSVFIYSFMNKSFREKLGVLFRAKCTCCKPKGRVGEELWAREGIRSLSTAVSDTNVECLET